MSDPKICEEVSIKEYKTGRVEFELPEGAEIPQLIVYKENGNRTAVGFIPKAGVNQVSLNPVLKGGRGYCELWFYRGNDQFRSKKIQVGWGKLTDQKEIEWEETAAKYKELATYCRQRIHVHRKMAKDAERHLRPIGREAHKDAAVEFQIIQKDLIYALGEKVRLDMDKLNDRIEEAKEKEVWANGKDGVNPPPPEQKWYEDSYGIKYLKAFDQDGLDRRPHELVVGLEVCSLHLHGVDRNGAVTYCREADWGAVIRGHKAWQSLTRLHGAKLGREISEEKLYLRVEKVIGGKKVYEICSFFVPRLVEQKSVDDDRPRRDMINQVREWRNDPLWKHLRSHTDRWDRVLSLLGVDNGFSPMPMSKIEALAKMPWGRRWKRLLKFLKSRGD